MEEAAMKVLREEERLVAKGYIYELRSLQILKEFEILKFFNLGPPLNPMDENLPLILQIPKKNLLPSKTKKNKK